MDDQRIDRRRFLLGASGAMLALPMLEHFAPRKAFAQTAAAPKRLVIFFHDGGRPVGNGLSLEGQRQDWWAPAAAGPFAAGAPSKLLASLEPVKHEIVTIDGLDNIVRHAVTHDDGHLPGIYSALTCRPFNAQPKAGGPSLDYVAGEWLRARPTDRASIILPGGAMTEEYYYSAESFAGANGSAPTVVSVRPERAIAQIFGAPQPSAPPPQKTLRERLVERRGTLLDAVAQSFSGLRAKVNAADRQRLDAHAEFIRTTQARVGATTGGPAVANACGRPSESSVPSYVIDNRGSGDGVSAPYQIENLVMALACDVVRVACIDFFHGDDPTYVSEFPAGQSPFQGKNWHGEVHGAPWFADSSNGDPIDLTRHENLAKAFQAHCKAFRLLVQRLAAITDVDGRRLLDNTLVVWVSNMGYGADHKHFDIPVVLAGMKDAFSKGQGRHVSAPRHTLGDLHAQILRMLGRTDTTFGEAGPTLGHVVTAHGGNASTFNYNAGAGFPGNIDKNTPLYRGPLDL